MSVRSLERLRRDQSALLAEYRAGDVGGEVSATSSEVDVVATLGKVTGRVTSDPIYGAHLVVTLQEFGGTPPVAQAASKPTQRVYPAPNHVVGDYSLNEFVLLVTARGALLGMKIG